MKKVAIITLTDNTNYGNRLQNYALQTVIEKLGYEATTIWMKDTFLKEVTIGIKKGIKYMLPNWHTRIKKEIHIRKFTKRYTKTMKKKIQNVSQLNSQFDFFVVGSDQVWNYRFKGPISLYFLPFADSEKTISYAASFGLSFIEEDYKEIIKKGIEHIGHISVRENKAREMIQELTGKPSQVVSDPTMLLTTKEWEKIEEKPKNRSEKKYILTYFLGDASYKKETEILANKKGYDIISLCDITQKQYYTYGINEFVYLFHHAEMVLTDSFHACVFSILFDRPFYVFDRLQKGVANMNTRIETLLTTFQLEDRKIEQNQENNEKRVLTFEHDYSKVNRVLEQEREKSLSFLKEALK